MVIKRVAPILARMPTWTDYEVMPNTSPEQSFMQILINLKEKILLPTIKYYGKLTVFDPIYLTNNDKAVPSFFIGSHLANLVFYVPILWERPEINASAHASNRTEDILVAQSTEKRAVTTHAIACNGMVFAPF